MSGSVKDQVRIMSVLIIEASVITPSSHISQIDTSNAPCTKVQRSSLVPRLGGGAWERGYRQNSQVLIMGNVGPHFEFPLETVR